ncbi:hemin uptake protein HemP [Stappia sp. ES.058]|uniref:hemin uptake protein HemP n=1 Tax=Stappia sp. ES.058 TaxID=1881061 RepID=UPI0008793F7D|nr:hemin uptake protein HemP [Stappia sp. ES.058]SDU49273.1 Hemin uptake protein HemP [Stappia sp. ES.058]
MPHNPAVRRTLLRRPGARRPAPGSPAAAPAPLELDSSALFQGAREVHIKHKDMTYRLSITRFEKLLLTK